MREKDDEICHPSIMMLGDSCTYGFKLQQSESIPACLENILRTNCGVPFRVYNAGVPGYSSQQSLYFFKRLAPVYKPDIIIVADFYGDSGCDYIKDSDRLLPEPLLTMKVFLWKSCAYRTLRVWFQNKILSSENKQMHVRRVPPDAYYTNVKKIKALGKKYNSCLTIITYYPYRGSNAENDMYPPYMKKLEDEHTIFVSLREIWKGKRKTQSDYFIDDIHFSGKGCEVVAGDLAEIIEGRDEFKELCQRYSNH
ncbi:MAG: hypothetical protein K6G50_09895 [bacterium]|nr:hypothetical protein [bacterium]